MKNSSLFPDGIRAALCSHRDIWQLGCGVDTAAGPGSWASFTWLRSFLPPSSPSKSREKYWMGSHLAYLVLCVSHYKTITVLFNIGIFGYCTFSRFMKSAQCLYLNTKLVVSTWLGQELNEDRSTKIKHRWIYSHGLEWTTKNKLIFYLFSQVSCWILCFS